MLSKLTFSLVLVLMLALTGKSNSEIAAHFKVTDSTVSRWRKHQVWIEFENELVAAYKVAALQKHQAPEAEREPLA